jgi:hypothetical protein
MELGSMPGSLEALAAQWQVRSSYHNHFALFNVRACPVQSPCLPQAREAQHVVSAISWRSICFVSDSISR